MQRTLLFACFLLPFVTEALAQGSCTQGVRVMSAYYAEGRHTASGQHFNANGLTAAHRTFPFGTRLVVMNPRNGRSVTVTINDRGPFVRGVALDLSLGAAKTIGMRGTGAVCMARLGKTS
jgi:rare lipoprotein A